MVPSLGNFSAYSFHGSVWRIADLVGAARDLGYGAVGVSDMGGFYGGVELSQACEAAGLGFILGVRMRMRHFVPGWLQFTVRTAEGYTALCRLVSEACGGEIEEEDVVALQARAHDGIWISCPIRLEADYLVRSGAFGRWRGAVEPWLERRWENFWLELGWHDETGHLLQRRVYADWSRRGWDRWVLMTASRHPEGAEGERLFEVSQSIGTLTRVGQRHPDKVMGGAHFLPEAEVWRRRLGKVPGVLEGTRNFVRGCQFDYRYGCFHLPNPLATRKSASRDRKAEDRLLRWKCLRGMAKRYDASYPWAEKPDRAALLDRLGCELEIVSQTGYAGYFLVFAEVVDYCRVNSIPVLARGSAAGSLICHCLGVSNVCPFRFGLSFERFLNRERLRHRKLPDIDLDLPWDRREEVMRWIYGRYGEDRVAMIGGFAHYQGRAAVAEVAKASGIPAQEAHAWTKRLPHGSLRRFLVDMSGHVEAVGALRDERFRASLVMAEALDGLPRHPMMHPCGMVIADRPIVRFTPVQPSANGFAMTQLAMDPIEDLGLLKLDLLGQAGLSVIRDCLDNLLEEGLVAPFEASGCGPLEGFFASVDYADPAIFAMIRSGGARGVFHIESPAMTSLLRLCRCADIDCLVATVSLIRPGAANEEKKTRFARRYLGLEAPVYAHPVLEEILRDSYGLMIYEEHILLVAHRFAGMDLGKADQLRRILIKKADGADLDLLAGVFAAKARQAGRKEAEIERVWRELLDFSGFMFNKAHGAAYAVEAYHGCWLKARWPLVFLAAVLNNGRGFYSPLVYVMEILRHGGRLVLPDVQEGRGGWHVEGDAVRIPLRQIKGLGSAFLERFRVSRADGPYRSWADFLRRARPGRAEAVALARCGALRAFWTNRHEAIWEAGRIGGEAPEARDLFEAGRERGASRLREMEAMECAHAEAEALGFPVTVSPWELWLVDLERAGAVPLAELEQQVGRVVAVVGIQVCQRLHRTRGGKLMKFISLADESGIAEICLFPETYRRYGWHVSQHPAIRARVAVAWDETRSGLNLTVVDVLEA